MPFDTIEAKKIINTLRAHTRGPGGEVMEKAANSLQEALTDAMTAVSQVRGAEAEALKARGQYEDALLENKRLRESRDLCDKAVVVLRDIATNKKGASQKAADWLTAHKLAPVVVPAATEATPVAAEGKK